MPIPQNGPLSLVGYSRPGETAQSKPKQAIIVRLSAETLDALESFPNQPQLDFLLSDHPGIYIGDTFLPMQSLKEQQPHEIYLRSSTVGKKSTPLKLYANVVGKFTVEPQLGDKLTDKIRESTIDAANQRNNRSTILLDTPPPMAPTKKRKDNPIPPPNMFRKVPRTSDTGRNNANSPSTSSTNHHVPTTSVHRTKEVLANQRQRMVHYIAVKERTAEDVIKSVGGPNCDTSMQRDIMERITEIADLDKATKTYHLKPESWREVRPYEFPRLDSIERTNMARTARMALKKLRIPESDPIWNQFNPRNLSNTASSSQPASSTEVPRRGITSKDVREKKAKPKTSTTEIMMKDEGARAIRSNQAKLKQAEAAEANSSRLSSNGTSSKTAPLRKPGSGFRAPKVNEVPSSSSTSSKPSNARTHKDIDTYAQSKPTASSSNPERRVASATNVQKIKKFRDEEYNDSDREGQRGRDWARERTKDQSRNREKEEGEHSDDNVAPIKRKNNENDGISKTTLQKRRKIDTALPTSTPPSNSKNPKARDAALPKRPENMAPPPKPKPIKEHSPLPPPLPKIKKDPSPLSRSAPPPTGKISPASTSSSAPTLVNVNRSENARSAPNKGNKINGLSKVRRRSPIYTSSEDEGEISSRPSRRDIQNSNISTSSEKPSGNGSQLLGSNSRALRALPTDRAGLRARYRATYGAYLKTYQRVVDQRSKLESMLDGSLTESEGDVELLDPEALTRLTNDHKKLQDELENIQQTFAKLTNGGSLSD